MDERIWLSSLLDFAIELRPIKDIWDPAGFLQLQPAFQTFAVRTLVCELGAQLVFPVLIKIHPANIFGTIKRLPVKMDVDPCRDVFLRRVDS